MCINRHTERARERERWIYIHISIYIYMYVDVYRNKRRHSRNQGGRGPLFGLGP